MTYNYVIHKEKIMNIKTFLVGTVAGALMLGAMAVPAFATQETDLTNNQWRLLTLVNLPNGNTNFMTSHPDSSGTGVSFPFPNPIDGHMVYMLGNYNNDLTDKTITVDASWTPSGSYETRGPSDGAYVRVEFQDVASGNYNSNDLWWNTGNLNLNAVSSGTLTASLTDRTQWTNICGKSATDTTVYSGPDCVGGTYPAVSPYDGFTNAMNNVKQVGLSFGRASSYASGVANNTSSTFNLTSFTVTP
jgi:hypothetical protein